MEVSEATGQQIERLLELNEALIRENKILREEITILKKGLFGRSSERMGSGQPGFFDAEDTGHPASAQIPERVAIKHEKKSGHGRPPFPPELLREVKELDVEKCERICSCCGKEMKRIGEEVTERGHMIPARLIVNRYVRPKYACPDGHEMKTAQLPDGVIDGGKYEASVYANIATAKYADHCVPRRQAHRPQGRMGVPRCTEDEGWPLGIGVQALVSNHLESFELRARAGSVERKGTARLCQVRSMETNASEPLITCREVFIDVRTGQGDRSGMSPEGTCLPTGRRPA